MVEEEVMEEVEAMDESASTELDVFIFYLKWSIVPDIVLNRSTMQ